ncbi:hypothetical protein [Pseudoponticoccus marisrubri]|uniref:Uncharacterized protein n=1 Tax=Pseudoponticoccus marisrubri TaxID=1685382 RepID=A0A0W7WEN0_9RHOB|nr:hypothetical protein [Pseudoponticoccus marisrubri]KUF09089.1 hypothetical protein AVJ23_19380 [Pseudoponticoccus marisrubri]
MTRSGLTALLTLCASLASAQSLPVFDETAGYEAIGTIEDGLLLSSDGALFYCEVDEADGESHLYMTGCLPILAPKAHEAVAKSRLALARDEDSFLDGLSRMPEETFVPAIAGTLRDSGCTVDMEQSEDAFNAAIVARVVAETGYPYTLSAEGVEEVERILNKTGELMLETGQVVVDRSRGMVSLVDCATEQTGRSSTSSDRPAKRDDE